MLLQTKISYRKYTLKNDEKEITEIFDIYHIDIVVEFLVNLQKKDRKENYHPNQAQLRTALKWKLQKNPIYWDKNQWKLQNSFRFKIYNNTVDTKDIIEIDNKLNYVTHFYTLLASQ